MRNSRIRTWGRVSELRARYHMRRKEIVSRRGYTGLWIWILGVQTELGRGPGSGFRTSVDPEHGSAVRQVSILGLYTRVKIKLPRVVCPNFEHPALISGLRTFQMLYAIYENDKSLFES